MSNINQQTLTALLQGKLAFKVYNKETSEWETLKMFVEDLETHTGAVATETQTGHVKLVTSLESQATDAAPTAKALATTFTAINSHVNEKGIHLTQDQINLIDKIQGLEDIVKDLVRGSKSNELVFYTNDLLEGDKAIRIKVPYNGKIIKIKSVLTSASVSDVAFAIEESIDSNVWTPIFTHTIPAGTIMTEEIDETTEINIEEGKLLRLYINGGVEDVEALTVNVSIAEL